jgi:hypothetical protein
MPKMGGLQDIHEAKGQEAQNSLDRVYGYNPEEMTEDQKKWWEKFLIFLRESKERDMQKFSKQVA